MLAADGVFGRRPQSFRWTCCGEGPFSEGCLVLSDDESESDSEDDHDTMLSGGRDGDDDPYVAALRRAGLDAVLDVCDLLQEGGAGPRLDVDERSSLEYMIWYDL